VVAPIGVRDAIARGETLAEDRLPLVGQEADDGDGVAHVLHGQVLDGDIALQARGQRTQLLEELLLAHELAFLGGEDPVGIGHLFPGLLLAGGDRVHELLLGGAEPVDGLRRLLGSRALRGGDGDGGEDDRGREDGGPRPHGTTTARYRTFPSATLSYARAISSRR
jgi:hypothetical protein